MREPLSAPARAAIRAAIRAAAPAAYGVAVFAAFWLTVPGPEGGAARWICGGAAVAATALSGRFPLSGAIAAAAATAAGWALGVTADPFLMPAAGVFLLAERRGRRRVPRWLLAALGAAAAALLVLGPASGDPGFGDRMRALALAAVLLSAAWVLGVRTRQLRARDAESARAAERLRLAREIHDVLSHSLGSIGVRAGVAAHVSALGEPELRETLRRIEGDARDSLAELRDVLQSERDRDGEAGAGAAGPPAPSVEDLLRAAEGAGLIARAEVRGAIDALPASVHTAAMRIAREAVTNTLRHASATTVDILLSAGPEAVLVEVRDDGTGAPDPLREGHGLTGMRERAAELGGELTIAPGPSGFLVRARLPLPAAGGRGERA